MTQRDPAPLPIHPRQQGVEDDGEAPSCSPKIYVSNEEAALLRELRALRERALAVRHQLAAADPPRRQQLVDEIEQLRALRTELVRRREAAFRRKMIMLGHLPPSALNE